MALLATRIIHDGENAMDQGWMENAITEWRQSRTTESLGELLKAQRHRAYVVAFRLTGSSAEAEDVVQEAFLKMLSRTHGFDNLEAFELSVQRAVVQCSFDALRKSRRRQVREEAVRASQGGETAVSHAQQTCSVESEEERILLRSAMTELSDDERAPVVLCYYQGMSVLQTAKVLELPRETVRARLARGMNRLRKYLKVKGKDRSVPAIAGLLWRDGAIQAPESLCSALDAVLPGGACSDVTATAQFGPAQVSALQASVLNTPVLVPAIVALAVVLIAAAQFTSAYRARNTRSAVDSTGEQLQEDRSDLPKEALRGQVSEEKNFQTEDDKVNTKVCAMVLAAGMLAPPVLQAGEPDAKAAEAISRIAARREAKAAAVVAAAEKRSTTSDSQQNPRPNPGSGRGRDANGGQ
jgi:RNA polymerase sigma-70 factor, ECF subfamily